MAGEWQTATFSTICEDSAFGPRFSGEFYAADGNVATLRTTDITEDGRISYRRMPLARLELSRLTQHLLKPDDLVITRSGRVGTAAVFDGFELPVLPGAFLIRFRLNRGIANPQFYKYFFNSPIGQQLLLSVATGSVQQNINITSVHKLHIPVPPVREQDWIVRVLGRLDNKIDLNRRMNGTLETMTRALFKSWFLDFEPVRAKVNGAPVLDAKNGGLFPSEFTNSPVGPIPRGWTVKKLSELCSTQYGYTTSATTEHVGPKFLRVMDINKAPWIDWARVPYCEIPDECRPRYRLEVGDVVVARMADPGKSAIIEADVDAVFASYLVRLKFKTLDWARFAYGFLQSSEYASYCAGARGGSVQANMNARVITGVDIVVPDEQLVNAFGRTVAPLRSGIDANLRESDLLAQLRDTLLPKLISGEIRVRDAERAVEAVG